MGATTYYCCRPVWLTALCAQQCAILFHSTTQGIDMTAKIEFFPVDNGDMTLLTLESGRQILIDVNIRKDADDVENQDVPDVIDMLRSRLRRDASKRPFVDAFLLSHPDADHCRGLTRHFHLGTPEDWKSKDDKIIVREMWSSPIIFRRRQDLDGELCLDAEAWWAEARRRVSLFRKNGASVSDGDRILILGKDVDGKTDDLADILVEVDKLITKICGQQDKTFSGLLLAPLPGKDDEEEELLEKNHSSTVIRFELAAGEKSDAGRLLTGGDAGVAIWDRLWQRHKKSEENLSYDVLLTPHHCSWRSLSYDSWSEMGEEAKVSNDARNALGQALDGALLIASSKEIEDDEDDPPCIRAKREYDEIADDAGGEFLCTADECDDDVLLITISEEGPTKGTAKKAVAGGASYVTATHSSQPAPVEKRGGGRYA
jgi:hypothetical protein